MSTREHVCELHQFSDEAVMYCSLSLYGLRLVNNKVHIYCILCSGKVTVFLPTGAPKAAETPAAAPADTKSRFSVSLRKYSKIYKHRKKTNPTHKLISSYKSSFTQKHRHF